MKNSLFNGVATALYTPFKPDTLQIDFEAFERAISRQLNAKVDALVLLGTTGEASTITDKERSTLIKFAKEKINNRIPLIVGCGSNCTSKAINFVKSAEQLNADGALIVTPYYNKCNNDGLLAHYSAICKETNLPIIAYNVPSRTGVSIDIKTYEQIIKLPNIAGIKEADNNKDNYRAVLNNFSSIIDIYCGSDENFIDFLSYGSSGIISVTSNIIPKKIKDIYLNYKLYYNNSDKLFTTLNTALFSDVNPIPLKCAVKLLYNEGYGLRLPLTQANEAQTEYLRNILNKLKFEV